MKKGQLGFIQTMLLIIVGAIVLFLVFGKWYAAKMQNTSDVERCRSTALLVDQGRRLTTTKLLNLDCPMKDVSISKADIEVKGTANKNVLFQTIAEEMRTCWYEMGDGTFLPIDQGYFGFSKNYCIICAQVKFDHEIKKELGSDITGFQYFLENTNMKKSDLKYVDYLDKDIYVSKNIPFVYYWNVQEKSLKSSDAISIDKKYYLVYNMFMPKAICESGRWLNTLLGQFTCNENPFAYLYLIRSDSLGNIGCSSVVN